MRDSFNNLCTNNNTAVLTASRQAGSGTLQGTLSATATGGVFTLTNLHHTVAGVMTAGFTSGALSATSGNITILPAAPATLAVTGNGQTAAPNTAFPTALVATVTDAYNNVVPGTLVQFSAPSSGASGTFSTGTATFSAAADAAGNVSTPLTSNGISGSWQASIAATGIAQPRLLSLKNETVADAWRQANFNTIQSTGPASDYATPHGDTVPNLHKFAFNLSATGPDNNNLTPDGLSGLPSLLRSGSNSFDFYFLRRKASTQPGLAWLPEWTTNLATYSPLSLGPATITSIDATWERVKVPVSAASGRYLRMRLPYLRDFNAGLGSATLRGTAVLNAGAVRLTNSVVNQLGAVVLENIPNPDTPTGFTVNFNVTMTGPLVGSPADGISLAIGALPSTAWGEAGPVGSHLTVGIDTYANGPVNDAPGIHVWANGVHLAHAAFTPNTSGTLIPVEVSYEATSGVTVKYNGTTVLTNVATPGFVFSSAHTYGVGGRTGGSFQTNLVDDIMISPR